MLSSCFLLLEEIIPRKYHVIVMTGLHNLRFIGLLMVCYVCGMR